MISAVASTGNSVQNLTVALVGNPNCGKTTLFNALTGLRQKVGNYPGVTVAKKEGRVPLPEDRTARLIAPPEPAWRVPDAIAKEIEGLQQALQTEHHLSKRVAFAEAISLLMQEGKAPTEHLSSPVRALIRATREHLVEHEIDFATQAIEA